MAGIGTGGTITGVGQALRARRPDVALIAVEPTNSAVLSGGSPGPHRIQGIGAGFVPEILDRSLLTEVRRVSEEEAEATRLDLARREGLLVGISAGAAVRVALEVARTLGPGKTVVTVLPDTGERYIATPPAPAAPERRSWQAGPADRPAVELPARLRDGHAEVGRGQVGAALPDLEPGEDGRQVPAAS